MYYVLKDIRYLWVFVLFNFLGFSAIAQEKIVKGIVTSLDDKSKLPGVSLLIKGSTKGTVTDIDGSFSIAVLDENAILVVSYVGYNNEEVIVGTKTFLEIGLSPSLESLSEVVVVGYGTQKRSDLTGAISSVSSKEIKAVPVTSMAQVLQGRAAGVQVTQVSNAPGGSVSIRIRGGNSITGGNEPLYVIDGFPLYNEAGASINPNDIESMEILKDASATAIYGSRGANGVVIITTKRGKAGRTAITFDAYYGQQSVTRKLPVLNATQYAELSNEAIKNENQYRAANSQKAPRFTDEQIASFGEGTNWQDEIFQKSPIENYQLNISGGDVKTRFSISANYYRTKGVVINSNFERGSVRVNLDKDINKILKIGNTLTISRTKTNAIATDGDGGSGAGVVYSALNFSPTVPVFAQDGTYSLNNVPGGILIGNPVAMAKLNRDINYRNRVLGSIFADLTITKGLVFKTSLGGELGFEKRNTYLSKGTLAGSLVGGRASINTRQFVTWNLTNTLTYSKTFNEDHNLTVLIGNEAQANKYEDVTTSGQGFGSDNVSFNDLRSAQTTLPSASAFSDWGLNSWLGRINYDLKSKYLITLSGRADGSSRFGKGNKYSFFPSGSIAWKASEEEFIRNLNLFSELKVRVSYGITGNQEIGQYQSLASLGYTPYNLGGSMVPGYSVSRIANPDLRWETTAQFDAGLDISLLHNRISITSDYYYKKTEDLLLSVNLPVTSGFRSSLQNIGSVENKGIELSVTTKNIQGEFEWTTSFNIAGNRNRIISLGEEFERPSGEASGHLQLSNSGILRRGEEVGSFFGWTADGIWQSQEEITSANALDGNAATQFQNNAKPGDRRYKDLDGNGVVNTSDRTIIGHALPRLFGGFTSDFAYKGIDLKLFFSGMYGNDILNINRFEMESLTGVSNQSSVTLDRWTVDKPSNTIPRANAAGNPYQISTRQIEDGSFLRLRTITLGYNLPSKILAKAYIQSARVYLSGQNIWTLTDYSGFDPEVSRFGQSTLSSGIDYGPYPNSKMILIGINLGL